MLIFDENSSYESQNLQKSIKFWLKKTCKCKHIECSNTFFKINSSSNLQKYYQNFFTWIIKGVPKVWNFQYAKTKNYGYLYCYNDKCWILKWNFSRSIFWVKFEYVISFLWKFIERTKIVFCNFFEKLITFKKIWKIFHWFEYLRKKEENFNSTNKITQYHMSQCILLIDYHK